MPDPRRALVVAAALTLGACFGGEPVATATPVPAPTPAAPAPPQAAAPEAAPADQLAPVPGEIDEIGAVDAVDAAAPAEPPPAPAEPAVAAREVDDDPERLRGLDRAALEALLGPPGFTREEADVVVWQYRGDACVLDVYLYSDGLAEPYRVRYVEARGAAAAGDGGRGCLRTVLLARREG